MEKKLIGFLKDNGVKVAGKRLRDCAEILNRYGFFFPPLYFGTLNIKLEQPFGTPEDEGIFISQKEIDNVAPGYAEWWKLIPIVSINSKEIPGFVYRTRQNCHGNDVIELVTEDLRLREDINLSPNERIEIIIKMENT